MCLKYPEEIVLSLWHLREFNSDEDSSRDLLACDAL